MKKIFLLLLFISSFLFAQDEIKRHPLWIDLGSGVATPKAQYNIYPYGNQLGNLGATANRWNLAWFDSTTTNHLTSSTLSGGVMGGTSLALGGATIGTNALAVTGTVNISSTLTASGTGTHTFGTTNFVTMLNGVTTGNPVNDGIGFYANGAAGSIYGLVINRSATNKFGLISLRTATVEKWAIGMREISDDKFRIYSSQTLSNDALVIDGINGNATFAGTLYAPNGSAASPSLSFTNDTNSGMYSVGADQLGLSVNGSNMVTVTTTGLGIGTTAPTVKLDVNGEIYANSSFFAWNGANYWRLRHGSNNTVDLSYNGTQSVGINITSTGNVGIGTTSPLAKFHDNGTAMFGAGTGASLTDSSLVINYTSGSPVLNWYGTDGDTWNLGINTSDHAVFSGATLYSFDNGITLADPGTSANSYAITFTADNATTPQYGSIQLINGADGYLRISAPNDAGVATAILDLKDQRVVIGAGTDGVDYDIFGNGFSSQGTITFMEDEDRWDFDNDVKVGASLWGSAQMSGTDAFTTTATADTVTVTSATVNDVYVGNFIDAVTSAEAPLRIIATATGFIAYRTAGTTSGAAYAWMRQRK